MGTTGGATPMPPDAPPPLLLDCAGPIARIEFNRPHVLNTIDEAMAEAFLAAVRAIAAASEVRVVIIGGSGRGFMAGGDLARFQASMPNPVACAEAIIGPLHEALLLLTALRQPVIGRLHGAVAGAGVSVALACDFLIAAADARFSLAYARVGASPDGSASWSLPRLVGLRKALEIALLAEPFDAAEALRLGLVNRVVPTESLHDEAEALARRLATGPTLAYGSIKRLLRTSFERDAHAQMEAEREAFCACARTADFAEGLNAFFGKRAPQFKGR